MCRSPHSFNGNFPIVNSSDISVWRLQAAIGVLALLLVWETIHPYFPLFVRGANPWRTRVAHGLRNVALGLLNAIAIRFVFLALWIRAMDWAAQHQFGMVWWFSGSTWATWIVVLLGLDAWMYIWHRASHAVPLLWRFHKLHHSDRHMDVTTANRFHLGEVALSAIFRVPVLLFLGCTLEMLAIYEILFFAVVQFHHANVAVPEQWDRWLRAFIVTPHLHKVHHSVVVTEQLSNFSSLLSIWDRLARTFRLSPHLSTIQFGVDE